MKLIALFGLTCVVSITLAQKCPPMELSFLLDQSENARSAASDTSSNFTTKFNILEDQMYTILHSPLIYNDPDISVGAYAYSANESLVIIPYWTSVMEAANITLQLRTLSNSGSWTSTGLRNIVSRPKYNDSVLFVVTSQGSSSSSRTNQTLENAKRVKDLGWNIKVLAIKSINPLNTVELTHLDPNYTVITDQPKGYYGLAREVDRIIQSICNSTAATTASTSTATTESTTTTTLTTTPEPTTTTTTTTPEPTTTTTTTTPEPTTTTTTTTPEPTTTTTTPEPTTTTTTTTPEPTTTTTTPEPTTTTTTTFPEPTTTTTTPEPTTTTTTTTPEPTTTTTTTTPEPTTTTTTTTPEPTTTTTTTAPEPTTTNATPELTTTTINATTISSACPPMELFFLLDHPYHFHHEKHDKTQCNVLEEQLRKILENPVLYKGQKVRLSAYGYNNYKAVPVIPYGSSLTKAGISLTNLRLLNSDESWLHIGLKNIVSGPTHGKNVLFIITSPCSSTANRRNQAVSEAKRLKSLGWNIKLLVLKGANRLDKTGLSTIDPNYAIITDQARCYAGLSREVNASINRLCVTAKQHQTTRDASSGERNRKRYQHDRDSSSEKNFN